MRWCTCPDNDEVIVSEDFVRDAIRYSIYYFECLPDFSDNSFFLKHRLDDLRVFLNEAYNHYVFYGSRDDCDGIDFHRDKLENAFLNKLDVLEASEDV